jgi:hypothetical protein
MATLVTIALTASSIKSKKSKASLVSTTEKLLDRKVAAPV